MFKFRSSSSPSRISVSRNRDQVEFKTRFSSSKNSEQVDFESYLSSRVLVPSRSLEIFLQSELVDRGSQSDTPSLAQRGVLRYAATKPATVTVRNVSRARRGQVQRGGPQLERRGRKRKPRYKYININIYKVYTTLLIQVHKDPYGEDEARAKTVRITVVHNGFEFSEALRPRECWPLVLVSPRRTATVMSRGGFRTTRREHTN